MQNKEDKSTFIKINPIDTDFSALDNFLNFKIFTIGTHSLTPAKIIAIFLVILIIHLVNKALRRIIIGKLKEDHVEYGRRSSIFLILKYILYVIGFVLGVEVFGISVNALLVGSAALLVGVGLGLQHIFSDLVSGMFLLFERPIEIGDVIELDDTVGRIDSIRLRHTVLVDRDGVNLIVPNHKFITEKVINWSHNKAERRFNVDVGVSYNSDPKEVTEILRKCASQHPLIIQNHEDFPIFIRLVNFGDSSLDFQLFFWTRHSFTVENTKSELRFQIFEEFRKSKVEIPFPQRDLHIKDGTF